MKKMIAAIALAVALPAAASAQAPQAPVKRGCCAGHHTPAQDNKDSPADSHQNPQR